MPPPPRVTGVANRLRRRPCFRGRIDAVDFCQSRVTGVANRLSILYVAATLTPLNTVIVIGYEYCFILYDFFWPRLLQTYMQACNRVYLDFAIHTVTLIRFLFQILWSPSSAISATPVTLCQGWQSGSNIQSLFVRGDTRLQHTYGQVCFSAETIFYTWWTIWTETLHTARESRVKRITVK